MTTPLFEIEDLHVSVEGREILRGVNLTLLPGEVHALMGRNGSGKSTLANALMGHPKYAVTRGRVRLLGEDVLGLPPDERARRGLFLAFQNPISIPGVGTGNFLRAAVKAVHGGDAIKAVAFRKELTQRMSALQMDTSFATRALNEGFSGGEKKRVALASVLVLDPEVLLLDEPLTALDARLRVEMRTEILRLRRSIKATTIYVTHDQVEAMTMSTRLAMMQRGSHRAD